MKIKEKLIELLGGVTREELDEEIQEGDYWFMRYLAEHENYLAMLKLNNTTAEAAQKALGAQEEE